VRNIFGFCDIRKFESCTEHLEKEIFPCAPPHRPPRLGSPPAASAAGTGLPLPVCVGSGGRIFAD
jgi:hypothetical protein